MLLAFFLEERERVKFVKILIFCSLGNDVPAGSNSPCHLPQLSLKRENIKIVKILIFSSLVDDVSPGSTGCVLVICHLPHHPLPSWQHPVLWRTFCDISRLNLGTDQLHTPLLIRIFWSWGWQHEHFFYQKYLFPFFLWATDKNKLFSLGPVPRPGRVMVLMCLCVRLHMCMSLCLSLPQSSPIIHI